MSNVQKEDIVYDNLFAPMKCEQEVAFLKKEIRRLGKLTDKGQMDSGDYYAIRERYEQYIVILTWVIKGKAHLPLF